MSCKNNHSTLLVLVLLFFNVNSAPPSNRQDSTNVSNLPPLQNELPKSPSAAPPQDQGVMDQLKDRVTHNWTCTFPPADLFNTHNKVIFNIASVYCPTGSEYHKNFHFLCTELIRISDKVCFNSQNSSHLSLTTDRLIAEEEKSFSKDSTSFCNHFKTLHDSFTPIPSSSPPNDDFKSSFITFFGPPPLSDEGIALEQIKTAIASKNQCPELCKWQPKGDKEISIHPLCGLVYKGYEFVEELEKHLKNGGDSSHLHINKIPHDSNKIQTGRTEPSDGVLNSSAEDLTGVVGKDPLELGKADQLLPNKDKKPGLSIKTIPGDTSSIPGAQGSIPAVPGDHGAQKEDKNEPGKEVEGDETGKDGPDHPQTEDKADKPADPPKDNDILPPKAPQKDGADEDSSKKVSKLPQSPPDSPLALPEDYNDPEMDGMAPEDELNVDKPEKSSDGGGGKTYISQTINTGRGSGIITDTVQVNGGSTIQVGSSIQFSTGEDSNFFSYFISFFGIILICYMAFHNKKRLIALVIEGKRPRRELRSTRRSSSGSYRKLENNFD